MSGEKFFYLVFAALSILFRPFPAFPEPLKVHPTNPRYFTDETGKAIYLTGSHTWGNMFDFNPAIRSAPPFDYSGYLDFLKRYNHNFARFWSPYGLETCVPCPYMRTGPGDALDGNPKLDLDQFNPEFFAWLRSRVVAARDKGIYAGITLFMPDGAKEADWFIQFLHPANNIQGIGNRNGARSYDLSDPQCTAIHEAYAREVIDHLNDLDNVIWEIGNEGDLTSIQWQYHFISFIRDYEASKPKQHLIGMSAVFDIVGGGWAPDNEALFESNADWIAPGTGPYKDSPPAADGDRISILDVDHIFPSTNPRSAWVFQAFLRGHHPILMDWYEHGNPTWPHSSVTPDEQDKMRKCMGYTLTYANKVNLATMTPQSSLASTGFCLANPTAEAAEYLVYLPTGDGTVDLSAASGELRVEWFNPTTGTAQDGDVVVGGARESFIAPFPGDALLYIYGFIPGCPDSTDEEDNPLRM